MNYMKPHKDLLTEYQRRFNQKTAIEYLDFAINNAMNKRAIIIDNQRDCYDDKYNDYIAEECYLDMHINALVYLKGLAEKDNG